MEFSTTQPRIAAVTHQQVLHRPAFVGALAIFGVFKTLAGIINLVSAIILFSNASLPGLTNNMFLDAACEFTLGALILASTRAFVKGKFFCIWLYAGSIMLDSLYNTVAGYPLNYVFMGFGLLMIWHILKFKDQLKLK